MAEISSRVELLSVRTLLMGLDNENIVTSHNLYDVGEKVIPSYRKDYIVSLMIGVPIIPLVIDGTTKPWRVLDGEKRLALLWAFSENKFPIEDSPYMYVGGRMYFDDLSLFRQRRLMSTKIPCYIINPPTSQGVVDDIKNVIKRSL